MDAFDYVIVAVFLGPVLVQGARDLWARVRSVVTGEAVDLERRKQAVLAEADRLARVREAARALVRAMRLEGSYRADAVPVALARLEEALGEPGPPRTAGTGEFVIAPRAVEEPAPEQASSVVTSIRDARVEVRMTRISQDTERMEDTVREINRKLDEQVRQLDRVHEELREKAFSSALEALRKVEVRR